MKTKSILKTLSLSSLAVITACSLVSCGEKKADPKEEAPVAEAGKESATAPTPPPAPPAPAPAPAEVFYSVEITAIGPNKIDVITALRTISPYERLKAAKDAVNSIENSPFMLNERVIEADAKALQAKFEEVGATVVLKAL